MIDDLQKEIAEFVAQIRHVLALDRVGDFVRFFDRVGSNAGECLLYVPGASDLRIPKGGHDLNEALNVVRRLQTSISLIRIMYIMELSDNHVATVCSNSNVTPSYAGAIVGGSSACRVW